MEKVHLTGITWNHSRGLVPLVATAQRFAERFPEVEIEWRKRSLQEFADFPIEKLAENFDLLIIDHPFAGRAALGDALLPLDQHLSAEFLADQAASSVGASHPSYNFGGHQWALAVDAAAPVAAWRPDLLENLNVQLPESWEALLELAGRGLVAVPAIPVDCLMNFFMLCVALGEEPATAPGATQFVSAEVGVAALSMLGQLLQACPAECLQRNPIATYQAMVSGDATVYCPFAFGYSNYARAGYCQRPLCFGPLVNWQGRRLRSTLGGTGLAVSAHCKQPRLALQYAAWVASAECQRTLYTHNGGQPGHRTAWTDELNNELTGGYFRDTLSTLDDAWLRPRYNGYLSFQDGAGELLHRHFSAPGAPEPVLAELNALFRASGTT